MNPAVQDSELEGHAPSWPCGSVGVALPSGADKAAPSSVQVSKAVFMIPDQKR
jgi:hypothetical protein